MLPAVKDEDVRNPAAGNYGPMAAASHLTSGSLHLLYVLKQGVLLLKLFALFFLVKTELQLFVKTLFASLA